MATASARPHVLALQALVVAIAAASIAAQLGLQLGQPLSTWNHVFSLVTALAGVACIVAARKGERLPWTLVGIGLLASAAGDEYWAAFQAHLEEPPFPSFADALWLGYYPPVALALLLLMWRRIAALRASLLVDGLIAALGIGAVATAFVLGRVADTTTGHLAAVITNLAYPVGDAVILGLVVAGLAMTGLRGDRGWAFLVAGFTTFAVVDCIYLVQIANGTYVEGTVLDAGWIVAPTLIALGATARTSGARVTHASLRTVVLPVLFALVALGILVWDHGSSVTATALVLASACVLAVIGRMLLTLRENGVMLDQRTREVLTDPLTGLGNRRRLIRDLDELLDDPDAEPSVLALLDLNGFKNYNDSFGHVAGDALLQRLGDAFGRFAMGHGVGYRMGGDEFCALLRLGANDGSELAAAAVEALAEDGEGFSIDASVGFVELPREAGDTIEALRLADQRMYDNKNSGRVSAGEQSSNVLVQALVHRHPELEQHLHGVAGLAVDVGSLLGLRGGDLEVVRLAAVLHDVGKMAIPERILAKEGPLEDAERAFVETHTLVGEKILQAAPSLRSAAPLVRSSHERVDGTGYPDRLEGDAIPLGSRIVHVCDAFDAMISPRPYAPARSFDEAIAELRANAGTQFDAEVVAAFCDVLEQRAISLVA